MLEGRKAVIKFGGNFEPVPADKYTCQIIDVNFKTQFNSFKGVDEEKLNFKFVILDDKSFTNEAGAEESTRGRNLWHAMTPTFGEKAWLSKFVKAVYGRELTKNELETFDPEAVVGKQVDIMVNQAPNKDNTAIYNNIVAYTKTTKKLEGFAPEAPEGYNPRQPVEKSSQPVVTDPGSSLNGLDPFLGDDLKQPKPGSKEALDKITSDSDKDMEEQLAEDDEAELEKKLAAAKARKAKAAK